jgi:hypothetical protein
MLIRGRRVVAFDGDARRRVVVIVAVKATPSVPVRIHIERRSGEFGFIASLARPGRNATGESVLQSGAPAKKTAGND